MKIGEEFFQEIRDLRRDSKKNLEELKNVFKVAGFMCSALLFCGIAYNLLSGYMSINVSSLALSAIMQ